jgi:hypothetical protein
MSGLPELAPPISIDHAETHPDRSPSSSTTTAPVAGNSSDEDQTAVPTPVDSRSIDQDSRDETSSSSNNNNNQLKRGGSKHSDSGKQNDGQEQKKGWDYGEQLKVSSCSIRGRLLDANRTGGPESSRVAWFTTLPLIAFGLRPPVCPRYRRCRRCHLRANRWRYHCPMDQHQIRQEEGTSR